MIPPIPAFSFNPKVELKVGANTSYEALIKGLQFVPLELIYKVKIKTRFEG